MLKTTFYWILLRQLFLLVIVGFFVKSNSVFSQEDDHLMSDDGARYHMSQEMRYFFKQHKDRIKCCQLPSYSPDYNPIEILWKKLKKTGIHLRYFPTFDDLINKVTELLVTFENTPKEVLKVFGFYKGDEVI